ncbi:hypothetical protein GCM10009624_31830 [Gordonia sinesedis]
MGQWLLGLLIVLAIAASILMVFTDNLSITGTLAVIAALWAAVIGAILVTRFRRQAESAESKSRDLRLVYELQLEREIAARRQYELDVEASIRREVSAEANQELADLKSQVLSLRASLEQLLGGPLPDERVALPNEKLRELASGLGGASAATGPGGYGESSGYGGGTSDAQRYSAAGFGTDSGFGGGYATPDDGLVANRDFAATAPAPDTGRHIPRDTSRDADPNELTEVIPVVAGDDPLSGRIATEVPMPADDAQSASPSSAGPGDAETVVSETVVDVTVTDYGTGSRREDDTGGAGDGRSELPTDTSAERRSRSRGAHERSESGTGSLAAPFAGGFYGGDARGRGPEAPDARTQSYTDETPTDEWAHGTTTPSAGGNSADGVAANGTETVRGRHGEQEAAGPAGRRRRADADDGDSAHSNGLPVAELLDQLRRTDSGAGGRRRRAD